MDSLAITNHDNMIEQETLITKSSQKNFFLSRRVTWYRRRKVQSIRLGGKKKRKGFVLVRLLKKVKLKWLKVQYSYMLKRLKNYYLSVVKDLIEAGATLETLQQRVMMETSFAIPVMSVSAVTVPSYMSSSAGPNYLRSNRY
ncbi:hypothetical protein AQUCO_03400044v1 [Aquilegia coerulea]|uniref:Uncharacterized protein n=1 Tax=Aquilegia coerulea TaxID=218851 RepID=A0A2G5CX90_AQUCA|nr:hypothetical protein AQUCO_03400044v1 [Aquilegia coerulea]